MYNALNKKKDGCTFKMDAPMYNALNEIRWMYTRIDAQMYNALDKKKGS